MGAFGAGFISPRETDTLSQRSADFNARVPGRFRANGLNQPIMMAPGNGNSAFDASRQTPQGSLPSMNGMSESTYQRINPTSFGMNLAI